MKPIQRCFDAPDEVQEVGSVRSACVRVGGLTVARTVHPPGFRWSTDVRPHVGTDRCRARHLGLVLSGAIEVELDDLSRHVIAPGAVYEIPPGHDAWVVGDEPCVTVEWSGADEWLHRGDQHRVLATLLFTDIVDSTPLASRLGDHAWRALLAAHDDVVRGAVGGSLGRIVKHTGDGILAMFDGPARALAAATRIRRDVGPLGIAVRIGVHVGEVELRGEDIAGLAVHEAARILSAAGPGDVLVSDLARALCAGAGLVFESRGRVALKGIAEARELFALSS